MNYIIIKRDKDDQGNTLTSLVKRYVSPDDYHTNLFDSLGHANDYIQRVLPPKFQLHTGNTVILPITLARGTDPDKEPEPEPEKTKRRCQHPFEAVATLGVNCVCFKCGSKLNKS